jgi:hypothetical protein
MSLLAALLLMTPATPDATATPAPQPQARSVGIARARILAPVRMEAGRIEQLGRPGERRIVHQAPRRDGARVIDTY